MRAAQTDRADPAAAHDGGKAERRAIDPAIKPEAPLAVKTIIPDRNSLLEISRPGQRNAMLGNIRRVFCGINSISIAI